MHGGRYDRKWVSLIDDREQSSGTIGSIDLAGTIGRCVYLISAQDDREIISEIGYFPASEAIGESDRKHVNDRPHDRKLR